MNITLSFVQELRSLAEPTIWLDLGIKAPALGYGFTKVQTGIRGITETTKRVTGRLAAIIAPLLSLDHHKVEFRLPQG
jgi:hypothetical protein